jgi:uncharacterized Zn-finger protein
MPTGTSLSAHNDGPPPVRRGRSSAMKPISTEDGDRIATSQPGSTDASALKTGENEKKSIAPFQCHLCPKRYTRAYNLRSHLRTHDAARRHACTTCTETFAQQVDLESHKCVHDNDMSDEPPQVFHEPRMRMHTAPEPTEFERVSDELWMLESVDDLVRRWTTVDV